MQISQENIQAVRDLNDRGLTFQAYQKAQTICPLEEWEGTEAILLASHIVYNLGAAETSGKWTLNGWKNDKKHPRALFYQTTEVFSKRGPLPVLLFIDKYGKDFQADEKLTAWWYSLHVEIYAFLRDFRTADAWHEKAAEAAPQEPWVWVAQSHSLEYQDRYVESLEMSRKALELDPSNKSAMMANAHILSLLEEDQKALEVLKKASKQIENVWILQMLANFQNESGMHEEAYQNFEKIWEMSPIKDKSFSEWLFSSLSDAAYLNGEIKKAIEYAEKSKSKFHLEIKKNLENREKDARRKMLNLGFVRQHQMTCAPATLSTISRFWELSARHIEIADAISYDGTPSYKERIWAEENGWKTAEFTVNWKDATSLLDKNIPFTLATVFPGNAHLQAIIGYDQKRGTFLVRDPYYRHIGEFEVKGLLETQSSNGPRGMVLIPAENPIDFDDLQLSESEIYDYAFEIDRELEKFNRDRALEILSEMEAKFPAHRLTLTSQWALAYFDSNNLRLLEIIEKLREKYPEDINLKLIYTNLSDSHLSREESLKLLESYCKEKKTDPLLWQKFGFELGLDARRHKRALHWLYKTLRKLPADGRTYRLIADILWSQKKFDEAGELYRFASCLNDKDENFAYSYFLAERFLNRTDKALRFLRDRFERFGHQSAQPAQSLFHALREIGRTDKGFEVLESALQKRPEDGDLKLFVAEAKARFGKKDEAYELLEQAKTKSNKINWLETKALLDELKGDFENCLASWREVIKINPLAYNAHENIAQILQVLEGEESAQNYLRKLTRKFPYNRDFHKLRISYLREKNTEAIAVLRHLVKLDPQDALSQRELSRWLTKVKKYEQALEAAQTAVQIAPNDTFNNWALGVVFAAKGDYSEAVKHFKEELKLSVDADYALNDWIEVCRTRVEKEEVLEFVRAEMTEQNVFGNGIIAYYENARRLVEPKKLLEQLEEIAAKKPDLWQSLSVIVQQQLNLENFDEALQTAIKNTKIFPLIYQVWHDLSLIYKLRGEVGQEIEALQKALEIYENWSYGIQQLCEAFERADRLIEARALLEKALGILPLDPFLHGFLASILWKLDEKEKAIETAKKAVGIEPEYGWAWQMIKYWSGEMDDPQLAVRLSKELTLKKPKDARSWLIYARMLEERGFVKEQLEAVEKALKLDPQNVSALAIKANALADAGKFEEALKTCLTELSDGYVHEQLRYVYANIEAARGNTELSIDLFENLTKSVPDYYPAWQRLADFYRQDEYTRNDYLRVAKEMARLEPQNHIALGYYAEALLLKEKREEAKKVYWQAVTLVPEYDYGVNTLFDLCLEDEDFDSCESLLQIMQTFIKDDDSLVREICFFVKKNNFPNAQKAFRKLCLSETSASHHFRGVLNILEKNEVGDKGFIKETLEEVCLNEKANAYCGEIFIELSWLEEGEEVCRKSLNEIRRNEKVWSRGVGRFMDFLVENKPISAVEGFIESNKKDLQKNTEVWALTGYIFNQLEEFDRCQNWMSDWKTREDVLPWMLWNYATAHRRTGNVETANQICREALDLKPDDLTNDHILMVGLDEFYQGDFKNAWDKFIRIEPAYIMDWSRNLYFLLEKNLHIFGKLSEGLNAEAEALTDEMIAASLEDKNIREDKVLWDNFKRSVKTTLSEHKNTWYKLKTKTRLFFSRII